MATASTSLANHVSAALQPMHGTVPTPNTHPGGKGTEATQISLGRKIHLQGKLV